MEKHFNKLLNIISFRTLLIVVLIVTGILQFFLMLGNIRGTTYDIQAFQLAPETIRAVKTVEDTVKTEQERDNAENAVEPVYVFNDETAHNRSSLVTSIFDILLDVRKDISASKEEVPIENQVQQLQDKLKDITDSQSQLNFTDSQLQSLLTANDASIATAKTFLVNLVETTLKEPIRTDDVAQVRNEIESRIRQNDTLDENLFSVLAVIGRAAIVETEVLDEERTEELILQAREEVEPTRILQGQIIVQEGELIDREVYRQLELLGLLNSHTSTKPVLGLFIFIVLQMAFMYILFDRSKTDLEKEGKLYL